jgi:hypothetical protein
MEILDDFQCLFIVMTVNSIVPLFGDDELGAGRPPFGQETFAGDLPMMSVIRNPQRQTSLLTPSANISLLFQICA